MAAVGVAEIFFYSLSVYYISEAIRWLMVRGEAVSYLRDVGNVHNP